MQERARAHAHTHTRTRAHTHTHTHTHTRCWINRAQTVCPTGYMAEHLGVPEDQVQSLTMDLYMEHGTTMAGLVAHGYKIDYDHWHDKVRLHAVSGMG